MNPRLQQLADQCTNQYRDDHGGYIDEIDIETFAELIVKSVMADLEKLRAEYANPGMYESVEYYDSMRAKESAMEDALDTIRYNFGVEQ